MIDINPVEIINPNYLEGKETSIQSEFQKNLPFPYYVFENFLEEKTAEKFDLEYPSRETPGWFNYYHVNEKTSSFNQFDERFPAIIKVIQGLQSPSFLNLLRKWTGIPNLIADTRLESGGLQVAERNGFLNIHSDFTVHPHHRRWRRRLNLLLYFNKDWPEKYGGGLELWDPKMESCVTKIMPGFNRALIFETGFKSYHGYPEALNCPESIFRKSLSVYYYTEEKTPPKIQSTNYLPRPQDSFLKGVLIYLDKKVLKVYDFLKRKFKIGDRLGSQFMSFVNFFKIKK